MKRRDFLMASTGSAALVALGDLAGAATTGQEDIKPIFRSEDPEVLRLTETVFQKCILEKIFPPEAPMKHHWIAPGGIYRGQWIWDTMFTVDLLSILPGKEKLIRGVFQNYWDFQVRWNKLRPEYAHDMVPCMIELGKENWLEYPAYSQIPILAWGVERVYRRNGDRELLDQCLKPLERFHEWYWRERDVTNVGLVAVGAYSGIVQHARYETFDYECNMDGLEMTAHPTRKGEKEGDWYGNICVTGNTSYLVMAERSLMRLAKLVGDREMAARRKARIDKAVKAMRTHMWDEEAGAFRSVNRDTLEKVPVTTIGSWMPLPAGVPTEAMAQRMAETLRTPSWQTPLPVPTVDRKDKRWEPGGFWRGSSWAPTNYQIACGLAAYGSKDLAAEITDKTVANAIKGGLENGLCEYYDSVSGKGLGVKYYGMACTLVTMMLDRLCRKYRLEIRGSW